MKKRMMTAAALAFAVLTAFATEKSFQSPDGRMSVTVNDEGGVPAYQVVLDGTTRENEFWRPLTGAYPKGLPD